MLGLMSSMDGGTDSNGTFNRPNGSVNVTNLECYRLGPDCPTAPETPQSLAHAFGEITFSQNECPYSTDGDIQNSPQRCFYFRRNDNQELAYRYVEYNLQDTTYAYPYLTDRIIKSSVGHCYQYNVSDDKLQGQIRMLTFNNATYSGILPIPYPDAGDDATTFVYNGTLAPQNTTVEACGPRCVRLYAYRGVGAQTNRTRAMFQCPITVGLVSNATQNAHNVSDAIARLAAASIALTGRYSDAGLGTPKIWRQYQLFPWG